MHDLEALALLHFSMSFAICCSCSPPAAEYALVVSSNSLLSRAGLGHLGKGWPTTRRWPYWLSYSSIQAGTGGTDLQLIGSSVAGCQALTWPSLFTTTQKLVPMLGRELTTTTLGNELLNSTAVYWVVSFEGNPRPDRRLVCHPVISTAISSKGSGFVLNSLDVKNAILLIDFA